MMKYGRILVIEFGDVDFVKYVESFGVLGFCVNMFDELEGVLKFVLVVDGFVIIDILIDYCDNIKLSEKLLLN